MSNELKEILAAAKKALTSEEKEAQRRSFAQSLTSEEKEAQRRSFAYGNTKIENDRITRKLVDEEADLLSSQHEQ